MKFIFAAFNNKSINGTIFTLRKARVFASGDKRTYLFLIVFIIVEFFK